eukprot:10722385-Alexandrium_andersonii.AAC.1
MQSASADRSWQATRAWGRSASADGVPAQSSGGNPQSGAGVQQPVAPAGSWSACAGGAAQQMPDPLQDSWAGSSWGQ